MKEFTCDLKKITEAQVEAIETEQALHSDDPVSIEETLEVS